MDWSSPFIVYRISAEGKLEEVFHAEDLDKARYWLTYIAKPGDVLMKTPKHPAHSGKSPTPEYWSHKELSGTPTAQEDAWKEFIRNKSSAIAYPHEQKKHPLS